MFFNNGTDYEKERRDYIKRQSRVFEGGDFAVGLLVHAASRERVSTQFLRRQTRSSSAIRYAIWRTLCCRNRRPRHDLVV